MNRSPVMILCTLASIAFASCTLASKPIPENTATVLGKALVDDPKAWCEFEVWGRDAKSLFVWALCEARSGTAASVPAVVGIKDDKAIGVKVPRDGGRYVRDVKALFPADLQQRILNQEFDVKAALERIAKRKANQ